MIKVKIVSSDPSLNFEGEWEKNEPSGKIVADMTEKAKIKGIPIMVTIDNHDTYNISPQGQVLRGLLFDDRKLKNLKIGKEPRKA
jgi:hypothetical protein